MAIGTNVRKETTASRATSPPTEEARGAVVDAPGPEQARLIEELGQFFAKRSAELDEALAAWARANREHFVVA